MTRNNTNTRISRVSPLLLVSFLIALLVGILLPAIGKARDQARMTLSQVMEQVERGNLLPLP